MGGGKEAKFFSLFDFKELTILTQYGRSNFFFLLFRLL